MPLREHFLTNSTILNWQGLHAPWPMAITMCLNAVLPEEYVARPRLQTGSDSRIDAGACESRPDYNETAWAPPEPTILLDAELPEASEYEVNIYTQNEFRLVAAVELVSPSNKDQPENRQTFVNKCETLLKKDVCVTIVDPVTSCTANLYGELLEELHARRTAISRAPLYAVTCRGRRSGLHWRLESWEHELAVGAPLPTLPIWLSPDLLVPLELEATYEETCRSLRIR
jgi:hypothetical protein